MIYPIADAYAPILVHYWTHFLPLGMAKLGAKYLVHRLIMISVILHKISHHKESVVRIL